MVIRTKFDQDGIKFLPWAKSHLRKLKTLRDLCGVEFMQRNLVFPDGATASVRTHLLSYGIEIDDIKISAGAFGDFAVYPFILQVPSPFTGFSAGVPKSMKAALATVDAFPEDGVTQVSKYYWWDGLVTRTQIATPTQRGYSLKAKAAYSSLVPTSAAMFLHNYTTPLPEGAAATENIFVSATGNLFKFSDGVALTEAYASNPPVPTRVIWSRDGKKGAAVLSDVRSDYVINLGAEAPANQATSTDTNLSPYGTQTTHAVLSGQAGTPSIHEVRNESTTVTDVASYPVCFGYSDSNVRQTVFIVHARSSVVTLVGDALSTGTNIDASSQGGSAVSETETLTMPGGFTKAFSITSSASLVLSGHSYAPGGAGNEGSNVTNSVHSEAHALEILYADASLPAVIYRYTKTVQDTPSASASSGSIITILNQTMTTTGTVIVAVIVAGVEIPILSKTTGPTVQSSSIPYEGTSVVPFGGNSDTTTVTDLTTNGYARSTWQPDAFVQFVYKSATNYLGSYKDPDETPDPNPEPKHFKGHVYLFGSKPEATIAKALRDYLVLTITPFAQGQAGDGNSPFTSATYGRMLAVLTVAKLQAQESRTPEEETELAVAQGYTAGDTMDNYSMGLSNLDLLSTI